ncbi:hypothetical protein Tco_1332421 [Tanacetum coccineum]
MKRMGFGDKWCKWVDSCLRSSTISILVNGSPMEEFCLEKWVRQVSGLRVNYNKSKLYRVGVSDAELSDMARWMKCGMGEIPFTYLGLPIGDNMSRVSAWNSVVEKFKSRLAEWKAKTMSFGRRLTLVKSVSGSLPLEGDALWVRIIKNIYGESGGLGLGMEERLHTGGLGVWRDIVRVGEGDLDGLGLYICSSFVGEVRNGGNIRFWIDRWVGGVRLCDRFPTLYHLDRRKEGKAAEKRIWVDGVWYWEWEWVWELRGRVCKEYEDLQSLLQNVVIMFDYRERWRWTIHESRDFTVKELTKVVEEKILDVNNGGDATIWNKWLPKKSIFYVEGFKRETSGS